MISPVYEDKIRVKISIKARDKLQQMACEAGDEHVSNIIVKDPGLPLRFAMEGTAIKDPNSDVIYNPSPIGYLRGIY